MLNQSAGWEDNEANQMKSTVLQGLKSMKILIREQQD